jgi:hypothetical protein
MSTVPSETSLAAPGNERSPSRLVVSEMWASIAISIMWLAVLLDALFGPDVVSSNAAGTSNTTTIPSAVFLALFAYLGTRVVARYGFHRDAG